MALTVSVALCTHNGARFLEEQLRSILEQTHAPNEIVLSDDASSDGTVELAKATVEAFRRANPQSLLTLRVLENDPALGVVKNFEQAAAACTGEFITLCDQDDRWHSDRVASVLEEFRVRSDYLLLHSDARLVDEYGIPLGYSLFDALEVSPAERRAISAGNGFSALLGRNIVTGATTIFRRELLARALPFPDGWLHDEWLAIIAAATGRMDFLEDQLIDYRQHGGNEIGASKLSLLGKFRRLREPRQERNRNLADRAAVLVDRLVSLGDLVSAANLDRALGKRDHEQFRLHLPVARLRRVRPVLREARAGGYAKFGRGRIDIVRDILQPD